MYLYGLKVLALGSRNVLAGSRNLPWHEVDLHQRAGMPPADTAVTWTDDVVTLDAGGHFSVEVVRAPRFAVRVTSGHPLATPALVHPVMAFVGAVVASWTGRLSFHAAAVVIQGRAWLVLAHPGGGKSTLAVTMRAHGHAVLSDDLAVVDGRTVLAGPRSADLREEAAAHLAIGRLHHALAGRERWRTDLGTAPYEAPLGGMVTLEWAEGFSLRRPGVAERLGILATFDALGRGLVRPSAFLDLLDVPLYEIRRARDWSGMDATLSSIEDLATAAPGR